MGGVPEHRKVNYTDFLASEIVSKDIIDVKRAYVDMADEDLVAGILLSQIIYWHLPDKNGKSKLRHREDGHLWLVKQRADWWEECRISEKQYDRAIEILRKQNLVETHNTLFAGERAVAIRIKEDEFAAAYTAILSQENRGELQSSPKGNFESDQTGTSITETTAERKQKENPAPTPKANVYAPYEATYGDLLGDRSSSVLLAIETLEQFPQEYVNEAFKRAKKKEAQTETLWRAYQRLPYAIPLCREWVEAGKILPERALPPPKTNQFRAPQTSGTSWDNMRQYD